MRARPPLPPSHLGTVIRAIVDLMREAGDPTPIMVGEHYARAPRGPGVAPHVILVPEPNGGGCELAAALDLGRVCKQVHACDVIVRAAESGDDIGRLDSAYALIDRVTTCIKRAGQGKVEFGSRPIGSYPSPTTSDAFGAGLSFSFTYDRDIAHDDAIMAVAPPPPPAPADMAPRPYETPGSTGTLDTLDGAAKAQDG